MDLCPPDRIVNIDIAETAGFYSQLTGVLAGFSFTALIFLIGMRADTTQQPARPPRREQPDISPEAHIGYGDALAPAYMALLASFIGLVLSSLGYAVLAGSRVSAGLAATEEGILGAGFALSGALVLYAIALTLEGVERVAVVSAPERQHVATMARDALAAFVAPVCMLYVILGSGDYLTARYGEHSPVWLDRYFWFIMGIQLIVSWLLYPLQLRRMAPWSNELRRQGIYLLSWGFLMLTFISAVAFGFMEYRPDLCATLPPVVPMIVTTSVFIAMSGMTVLLATTRPTWPPARIRSN